MVLKKKGESSFKLKDYETACNCYKEALADVEKKFNESKPDLKMEASKISSNVSLMYFKLSKELNDESFLNESKSYAKTTIKYNPKWIKGYLRLVDTCGELKNMDDALDAITLYLQNNKDDLLDNDFQSLLVGIKYYTHKKIMMLSPSWHLLKYPDNASVIDPLGAGNFLNFQEFLNYYGTFVKEKSILVRPGIYIGSYVLTNADIDIVGDCEVEINSTTKAIDKDPTIVFSNAETPIHVSKWIKLQQETNAKNGDSPSTFYFKNCKISMKRISVNDEIMHHPIHAVVSETSKVNTSECAFFSKFSAGYCCVYNSKLKAKTCRNVGSYDGVMVGDDSYAKLTDYFITEISGCGVDVNSESEMIILKNCTVTKCKKQGLVVCSGSRNAKVFDCLFEDNCSAMTINEGSIQLHECKALIRNTTVRNQHGNGIVIEGGCGYFDNLTVKNCLIGFLIIAKVQIVNSNIQSCPLAAIELCENFKGPIELENNTIKKCMYEIERSSTSPMPVFKGTKTHKIRTSDMTSGLSEKIDKMMKQPRGEDGTKGFNIGPVGDVLELNDKAHPFFKPPSAQTCEYCGYSEFQLKRKL